jgi:hypothetical protein
MKQNKYYFESSVEKVRRMAQQAPPPARLKLGTLYTITAATAGEYMSKK